MTAQLALTSMANIDQFTVTRARSDRAARQHWFMMPWLTLVSSLAAAIIGGLVAPLVSQRRERSLDRR